MSDFFHTVRRQFDKAHRQTWEDALSSLDVIKGDRVRVLSTTPEKVFESPGHRDLPDVSAQVIFVDDSDVPRVTLDFYEASVGIVVGVTYYLGQLPVAGGFNKVMDAEAFIAGDAEATARFLDVQIQSSSEKLEIPLSKS